MPGETRTGWTDSASQFEEFSRRVLCAIQIEIEIEFELWIAFANANAIEPDAGNSCLLKCRGRGRGSGRGGCSLRLIRFLNPCPLAPTCLGNKCRGLIQIIIISAALMSTTQHKQRTADGGHRTVDGGPRTEEWGLRTEDKRLIADDCWLMTDGLTSCRAAMGGCDWVGWHGLLAKKTKLAVSFFKWQPVVPLPPCPAPHRPLPLAALSGSAFSSA